MVSETITPQDLTKKVREKIAEVREMLEGRNGLLQSSNHNFPLHLRRRASLVHGIRSVSEDASNQSFEILAYGLSGSDISTGVQLLSAGDNQKKLITIDGGNLYGDQTSDNSKFGPYFELTKALDRKILMGMHYHKQNVGLLEYALELNLLQVDPNSFLVDSINAYAYSGGTVSVVKSQFKTGEGKNVEHTNIGGLWLPNHIKASHEGIELVDKTVSEVIKNQTGILVLRKGGDDDVNAYLFATLYSQFPSGTTVLSDVTELETQKHLASRNRVLSDLFTPNHRAVLANLHRDHAMATPDNSGVHIGWGYLRDVTNLNLYQLR